MGPSISLKVIFEEPHWEQRWVWANVRGTLAFRKTHIQRIRVKRHSPQPGSAHEPEEDIKANEQRPGEKTGEEEPTECQTASPLVSDEIEIECCQGGSGKPSKADFAHHIRPVLAEISALAWAAFQGFPESPEGTPENSLDQPL
jgi:hypothetical protein